MNIDPVSLQDFGATLHAAETDILALKYLASRADHLAAIALALHTLELAHGICHLLGFKARSGVPVLLRSMLEAAVRTAYLASDSALGAASLELTDNLERLKVLRGHKLSILLIRDIEERNKVLRKAGAKSHDLRQMLAEIAADDWYLIFSYLSNHSHANLTGLSQRFFSQSPSGTRINYHSQKDPKAEQVYLYSANLLLNICWSSVIKVVRGEA